MLHKGTVLPYKDRMPDWKRKRAGEMRRNPTPAEAALWGELQFRKQGSKWRRQVPMLGYIADFYCPKAQLVVEVDGGYHDPLKDRARDSVFARHGFFVIRFTNERVLADMEGVLARIRRWVALRTEGIEWSYLEKPRAS